MAEARLSVRFDGRDVARGMAQITGVTRRASAAMNNDERQASRERLVILRQELQNAGMMERQREADRARALRAATDSIAKAERDRERFAAQAAAATTAFERRKSMAAEAESARRVAAAKREANEYIREELRKTDRAEREERRRTQTAERAAERRRVAERRENARTVARFAVGAAQYGSNVLSGSLDMVQQARAQRAETSHNLNLALYQAGAGAADAPALQRQVFDFAQHNRMSSADLAAGINAAQTEFSSLGTSRSTQAERQANLNQMLQTALFARNTGQDVGQVLRVSSMLQNAGITGTGNRAALLGLTGMAQRGAIELGSVTREAMQPMQMRMAQARVDTLRQNPHASDAEVASAQQQAAMQSFAEIEVARGLGASPRRFSRVMAQLGTDLQGGHRQSMLLNNINQSHDLSDAQRAALRGMFDQHGHLQQQFQSGLGFAAGVNNALGGDVNAMRNVFTGGGHGNPMGLQTNFRDAIAQMMGGGPDVQRMLAGLGHDFTEQDVQRGANLFGGEDKTTLQGNEEERMAALMNNTGQLQEMNQNLQHFNSAHPFLSQTLSDIPGIGKDVNLAASQFAAQVERPYSNQVQQEAHRLFMQQAVGSGLSQEHFMELIANRDTAHGPQKARNAEKDAVTHGGSVDLSQATIRALAATLAGAPIVARVSPADAVHAQTVASTAVTTHPPAPVRH